MRFSAKNGENIELQFNEAPVPVFKDDRCVVLGTKESGGHLLAFGCEGRRIFLHVSHYIADGMSICPLLLSVLYLYISSKYGEDGLNSKRILMPSSPISDAEYAYPFHDAPALADDEAVQGNALKQVYSFDGSVFICFEAFDGGTKGGTR